MKKKLLALTLSLLLLCGASFPALANDSTVAMLGDEPLTQADLNSLEYRNITDETLTLVQDVTLEMVATGTPGVYTGLSLTRSNLDLNGFTLTLVLPSSASNVMMVTGISCVNSNIQNGMIIFELSATIQPDYGMNYLIFAMEPPIRLENVELSASNSALTAGVGLMLGQSTSTALINCVIDVGESNAVSVTEPTGTPTQNGTVSLESGSFKNLPEDNSNILITGTKLTTNPNGVDAGTTVITSDATTAIIVDNGNAYLYDTLQDAVDAASRRADDSGNVEIQLLKQPEDGTVELPADVSAEDITISKLGDDSDINLGGIIMTDSNDNKVTVGDDGKLETIIAVESVTLDKTSLDLYVGNTAELNATVEPENAADKIVAWSSSDPTVATVDANGNVKALKPGTTTITATAGGKSATCTVTVSYPVNIPDTYDIDLIVGEGGEAKTSLTNASAGSTITVTVTPDEGYELDYITVDGERIDGTTFTMPAHDVTVRVYFTNGSVDMPFVDVNSGDWFYDYVAYVYSNGQMDGTSATTFDPNGTMTRAMVWAILARVDGETVTGAAWATDARAWAIAEGVSDGTDPNGLVTREQFATMLYRYAVAKGYDVSIGESTNILSYADFGQISEYAIPAMQWACGSGIVTGVTESTLEPAGTATRAQCAAMLMRFVEL